MVSVMLAVGVATGGCGMVASSAQPPPGNRTGAVAERDVTDPARANPLRSTPLVLHSEVLRPTPAAIVAEPGGLGPELDPFDPVLLGSASIVVHPVTPTVTARYEPRLDAPEVVTLDHPTSRGGPLVFRALGPPTADGWIQVLLPVRPNGTTGWIPLDDAALTRNPYRITIDVANFALTVTRDDEVVLQTQVALGTGDTPTPIGDFYLTELLRPTDPTGIYGPYAYGLSGFSDTLDSFNGGPGGIGIHGTNQPELLGTTVSHGCIRLRNDIIEQLTTFLPLGTPVSIH
ncbi:MAG: L,D-transpeptidase [Acidimicrobiales bacterium]